MAVLVTHTVTQWLCADDTYCDNGYVLVTFTVTQWLCAGDTYCATMANYW